MHLKPETESRLKELVAQTGRAPDELLEDALGAYLQELARVRETLDGRYDDIESGRVTPIDGEAFFESLREREELVLKQRSKNPDSIFTRAQPKTS